MSPRFADRHFCLVLPMQYQMTKVPIDLRIDLLISILRYFRIHFNKIVDHTLLPLIIHVKIPLNCLSYRIRSHCFHAQTV